MKLINYFEDISKLALINPSEKIKKNIKNLSPNIDFVMSKTDYLEGKDILAQKVAPFANFLGKFYYQKILKYINKNPKKNELLNYFKKFSDILIICKRKLDDHLSNVQSYDDQLQDQNLDNMREIFFYSWLLYNFLKKNEKMLMSLVTNSKEKKVFETSLNYIWGLFESENILQRIFEKQSKLFFRKTDRMLKPFNNNVFYKLVNQDNKDFKKKQKENEGVETYYLQYIGDTDNYDYRYKCIRANGTFDTEFETIFDAYFIEVGANQYTFFETPISYDENLLGSFRKNPGKIEQLKQIYTISELEEKKLLNDPIKKVKINKHVTINIKLDDNEEIKLDPLMVPFGELSFE